MNKVKKVATINDLSGIGRCSLTAAIPILSVLGVQCCPHPTAVLSSQTGFDKYTFLDMTEDDLKKILKKKKVKTEDILIGTLDENKEFIFQKKDEVID